MNLPMKRILAICLSSLIPFFAIASDGGEGDAVEGPVSSVLDNGLVSRTFSWEDGHFTTSSYRISGYDREFVDRVNEEFSFLVNDMPFSGRSSWEVTPETLQGEGGSRIFRVTLDSRELQGLEVQVTYTAYPDIPLVKKQMAFRNSGVKNMRLESFDVENLQMQGFADNWVMRYYGRYRHVGPYVGDWDDPVIVLHDLFNDRGIALGAFRARLLAWQRTPAIPASTLVMGNLRIDDPEYELAFKSLCGALPVMLGDPRQLSAAQRKNLKDWSTWLGGLQQRHGYMSFRQDLPGYGEPQEGCWDGFARINTDTRSGGLVGIFRQGSPESRRTVTVKYLDPDADYLVREGKTGRVVARATGRELETSGFTVYLSRKYDGQLFEIVRCRSHAGTTVR